MKNSFRLVVIADVGGEKTRHLGDEAMLEANLQALRGLVPQVAFTVVSRDPAWTAARYGVDSVPAFGFSSDLAADSDRVAMLDRLLAEARSYARVTAAGKVPRHLENATTAAVAAADGLVVSGGGNLSSTWPELLYERVALLQLARIFGKPAVVVGQTIGPRLTVSENRLLSEALSSALLVGVRERPSAALALELGVSSERLWHQSDDALFLETTPAAPTPGATPITSPDILRIAVTIDPQVRVANEGLFGALVCQLREISLATHLPLILIPHAFGNEDAAVPSDLTEANLLAEALEVPLTVVAGGLDAEQAMQLTGEAAFVISTRYHPIVFGLAAGVPSIGIYGDDYCRIKLQGALAHAELDRWTLTYDEVSRGELVTRALELWTDRDQIRSQIESYRDVWRDESRRRWAASPARTRPSNRATFGASPTSVAIDFVSSDAAACRRRAATSY